MSHGEEPFTGAELRRFFEIRYGAKHQRQTGSHVSLELPDGRVLRCMDDKGQVTKSLMRWNAGVLGISYAELRRQVAPIQNKNKPRFQPERRRCRTVSKKQALACLDALIGEATELKKTIANGDRDPVVYQQIHERARSARCKLHPHDRVRQ
jgi:hypothetical protein